MALALLFCISCQGNTNKQDADLFNDYVHIKPDSILSEKDIELKYAIMDITIENMAIKNNKFVFKLSKREFLKTGIPLKYYDLIIRNVKDNNKFIRNSRKAGDNLFDNLDAMWEETKNEYYNSRSQVDSN
ncbi:MAG: hypothetical protein FWE10_06730 [Rikenellaceae bacterium]|nr:hypothetical protein [Rikenellaceae bacterium]